MLIILKLVSVILIFAFAFIPGTRAHAAAAPCVSAEACVLVYKDGRRIFEKNADSRQLIASTTKLMTAIICLEEAELEDKVKIKPEHCSVEGSSMYLKAGERYTVEELLLGLLLASGNDAALALADHVSGSSKEFAELMNEKAEELDMRGSSFSNPHGLDERGHYSTAGDMARLMLYCMENDDFVRLTSTWSKNIKELTYINHNKLLKMYPGCIGGKTGFTSAAGRCLVSCAERDGMRFVCVTLSAPDDWKDHCALYDYAFDRYRLINLSEEACYQIPLVSGSRKSIAVKPGREYEILLQKNEALELVAEIPQFVFAPIKNGETAGKLYVIIKNNAAVELPLVYTEDAALAFPF